MEKIEPLAVVSIEQSPLVQVVDWQDGYKRGTKLGDGTVFRTVFGTFSDCFSPVARDAALASTLQEEPAKEENASDLLERAWAIIANAGGGNWYKESDEWREAAIAWRDDYHNSAVFRKEIPSYNELREEISRLVSALTVASTFTPVYIVPGKAPIESVDEVITSLANLHQAYGAAGNILVVRGAVVPIPQESIPKGETVQFTQQGLRQYLRECKQTFWLLGNLQMADRAAKFLADSLPSDHEKADLKEGA